MTIDRERQVEAANRLEELAIAAKHIVQQLRMGHDDGKAYALVYVLRRRLGHVVRDMGRSGEPYPQHREWAETEIDAAIWEGGIKR